MLRCISLLVLGDSRNYMSPILVLSPAKRIARQIIVIANLNEKKKILELLFVISFVPARNYVFKVSNCSTGIMYESCSMLRMSMLTIFNINDIDGVALVFLLLTVNIFQILF